MHKDTTTGIVIVHPGDCKCENCKPYKAPCYCEETPCICDDPKHFRPMTPRQPSPRPSPRFKKVKKSSKSYKKVKKLKKAKKSKRKNKKTSLRR